jgi:hypothetical protein
VSTTAARYKNLHQWIAKSLAENNFPYNPYVRQLKYGGETTKFSSVLSAATSVANTAETPTTTSTRNFSWKQRPPLNISYVLSNDVFPALPKARPTVTSTPSTTSETLDEDTIQSAITAALSKLEAQHQAELASLKQEMQKKMDELEAQMKEMTNQVTAQTYQALVSDASPLTTKTDHAILQHEMNIISKQLTTLIHLFQSKSQQDQAGTESPPRTTKRNKPCKTPEKLSPVSDVYTQDNLVPSATSEPDEGMEGCDE